MDLGLPEGAGNVMTGDHCAGELITWGLDAPRGSGFQPRLYFGTGGFLTLLPS